jgi:hypothetical protein
MTCAASDKTTIGRPTNERDNDLKTSLLREKGPSDQKASLRRMKLSGWEKLKAGTLI